jgi:hypothetical protein
MGQLQLVVGDVQVLQLGTYARPVFWKNRSAERKGFGRSQWEGQEVPLLD